MDIDLADKFSESSESSKNSASNEYEFSAENTERLSKLVDSSVDAINKKTITGFASKFFTPTSAMAAGVAFDHSETISKALKAVYDDPSQIYKSEWYKTEEAKQLAIDGAKVAAVALVPTKVGVAVAGASLAYRAGKFGYKKYNEWQSSTILAGEQDQLKRELDKHISKAGLEKESEKQSVGSATEIPSREDVFLHKAKTFMADLQDTASAYYGRFSDYMDNAKTSISDWYEGLAGSADLTEISNVPIKIAVGPSGDDDEGSAPTKPPLDAALSNDIERSPVKLLGSNRTESMNSNDVESASLIGNDDNAGHGNDDAQKVAMVGGVQLEHFNNAPPEIVKSRAEWDKYRNWLEPLPGESNKQDQERPLQNNHDERYKADIRCGKREQPEREGDRKRDRSATFGDI